LVQNFVAGFIIGKQKVNLNRISSESGSACAIDREKDQDWRAMKINGSWEQIRAGTRCMFNILQSEVDEKHLSPPKDGNPHCVQVLVEHDTMGRMIGRGGETIRKMREESGAEIKTPSTEEPVKALHIIGEFRQISLCIDHIIGKFAEKFGVTLSDTPSLAVAAAPDDWAHAMTSASGVPGLDLFAAAQPEAGIEVPDAALFPPAAEAATLAPTLAPSLAPLLPGITNDEDDQQQLKTWLVTADPKGRLVVYEAALLEAYDDLEQLSAEAVTGCAGLFEAVGITKPGHKALMNKAVQDLAKSMAGGQEAA
jgi:hypothetical protein